MVYLLYVVVLVRVGCTFGREMCWLYGGIGLVVNKYVKSLHNLKITTEMTKYHKFHIASL